MSTWDDLKQFAADYTLVILLAEGLLVFAGAARFFRRRVVSKDREIAQLQRTSDDQLKLIGQLDTKIERLDQLSKDAPSVVLEEISRAEESGNDQLAGNALRAWWTRNGSSIGDLARRRAIWMIGGTAFEQDHRLLKDAELNCILANHLDPQPSLDGTLRADLAAMTASAFESGDPGRSPDTDSLWDTIAEHVSATVSERELSEIQRRSYDLDHRGQTYAASIIARRGWKSAIHSLGPDHETTLFLQVSLASYYIDLERTHDAIELCEDSLGFLNERDILNPNLTFIARFLLLSAGVPADLHPRLVEARDLETFAREHFGPNDRRALSIAREAARLRYDTGDREAGLTALRGIRDQQIATFGRDDLDLAITLDRMIAIAIEEERWQDVLNLSCEVYELTRRHRPEAHIQTLKTKAQYGRALLENGHADRAATVLKEVWQEFASQLGARSRNALSAGMNYAAALIMQGDKAVAANVCAEIRPLALSASDPDIEILNSIKSVEAAAHDDVTYTATHRFPDRA